MKFLVLNQNNTGASVNCNHAVICKHGCFERLLPMCPNFSDK